MTSVVQLRQTAAGVEIPVRVVPRAKRDEVAGERNGAVCIRLTAPPVEGAANQALVRCVARWLAVPQSAITLGTGERSRLKVICVRDTSLENVVGRLSEAGIESVWG